jgi:hypothetical protein
MPNDKKNLNTRSRRVPSVEETTAAIMAEQEREEATESLPQSDKSATFELSNQSSSSENMERSQDPSNDDRSKDQGKQPAHSGLDEVYVPLVPLDCQECDDKAQKILENLQLDRDSGVQNHSLLIDNLRELGMFGEL